MHLPRTREMMMSCQTLRLSTAQCTLSVDIVNMSTWNVLWLFLQKQATVQRGTGGEKESMRKGSKDRKSFQPNMSVVLITTWRVYTSIKYFFSQVKTSENFHYYPSRIKNLTCQSNSFSSLDSVFSTQPIKSGFNWHFVRKLMQAY